MTKLFVGAKILPQEGFRMWKDVYADFTDLPKHEQQKLFNLIKEEFFSDEEEMKDAFTAIREARF